MSKVCANCGKKIGLFDLSLNFRDKKRLCGDCIAKYGFSKDAKDSSPTFKAIDWAGDNSYSAFEELKEKGEPFSDFIKKADAEKKAAIAPTNYQSPSDNSEVKRAAEKINKLRIPKELRKQLIDAKVFDFWFNNKELKSLKDVVEYKDGEVIKYAASGSEEVNNDIHTVLVLCTNRRVIFINKNLLFGGDSTDIPLNMVNAVQLKTHLVLADITIVNGANSVKLKNLDKQAAPILAKVIKNESLKFQQKLLHPQAANAAPTADPADEIRKFKKLADDGIITNDEFEAKKKQLLGL